VATPNPLFSYVFCGCWTWQQGKRLCDWQREAVLDLQGVL